MSILVTLYDCFDNGEKVTDEQRKLMREKSDIHIFFEDVNPYVVDQKKSYYRWYLEKKAGKHYLFKDIVRDNFTDLMIEFLRKIKKLVG